ncbi:MAG: hypothetical protein H0Z24_03360 [Thermosipho sp. (in: Bacteria)]|nr:hypothetical protein [Thermosipho sp. (in: thermotogales)]
MPKVRTKPYNPGDRFTVKIPKDVDPILLKWLNNQKFLSPTVIQVLEAYARKTMQYLEEASSSETAAK